MKKRTIKLRIKSIYRDLSKKDIDIANYVVENSKAVSTMTITELSSKLNLADSTIFQFTKKLGYSGFREFHNDLVMEEFDPQISIHENIKKNDSPLTMCYKVFESSIESLNNTKGLIKSSDLIKAVQYIDECTILNFFGVGGSNVVAYDAYHKFLRSPIKCEYNSDYHIQLMQASLLNNKSCAILTSHTGITKESINLAEQIKKRGSKLIVLTSYAQSPIAKLADIVLISSSEETGFRTESLSSRISQLAIIDSLFTIIMFNNDKKSKESLSKIRDVISTTKKESNE